MRWSSKRVQHGQRKWVSKFAWIPTYFKEEKLWVWLEHYSQEVCYLAAPFHCWADTSNRKLETGEDLL